MLNGAFDIEKLRYEHDLTTRYRMQLCVGTGEGFRAEFSVDDIQEDERSLREMITLSVDSLLNHLRETMLRELDELYRRTGDYYSTAEQRVQEDLGRLQSAAMMAQSQSAQQNQLSQMAMEMQRQNEYNNALARGIGNLNFSAEAYRRMIIGNWGEVAARPTQPQPPPDRDERAMKLLSSKIGWRKMRQLKKRGYFEENGKHGVFRFHMNTQGGVSLIERKKYGNTEREVEWTLCVQSMAADLPKGDVILSRWMEWKADENKFLDTANFRSVHARDEATQGRV